LRANASGGAALASPILCTHAGSTDAHISAPCRHGPFAESTARNGSFSLSSVRALSEADGSANRGTGVCVGLGPRALSGGGIGGTAAAQCGWSSTRRARIAALIAAGSRHT
jgi:hypothetical protein